MHDMISGRDLHVRSLNHLIRDHRFSYVGARIFAESIDSSVIDSWTDEYIARKTRANRRQAYWKHSLFKGFGRDGKPEYRKCVVGSPTTTLTEIWLLSRLSREEAFALPPYVYSYQWSSSRTHVFRYFFKGYMDREREIAQATKEMADSRVVVFDLRKFYPSIQVSTVRDRFAKRVARSNLNPEERATAFQCIDELTSIEQVKGLPIGSPLSHMLANVFLENFDRKLSDKFGGRYFRYVDDVAIVVPRGDLKSAKLFFIDTAAEDGLEVNSEKEDVVTGEKWADRVARRDQDEGDSLARLFSDLRRYLGHRQHDYDRIHDNFRAEGFAFPFPRLRSVAATSPYRRFLRKLWSKSGGLFGRNIRRSSALLGDAIMLRSEYENRLRRAIDEPLPPDGMARRWALQGIRYSLNRCLYLLPAEKRSELLDLIRDFPELRPTMLVLDALITGDASELTRLPGPTAASFCELWAESMGDVPRIDWSQEPTREERDGASVLALHGLCSPPEWWTGKFQEPGSRVMVDLSSRKRPTRRTFGDFSYIDEMESLFLSPKADVASLLNSRFDDGEDVVLPTLSLGGADYMS